MQVEVNSLYSSELVQKAVAEALAAEKKITLRFANSQEQAQFMDEWGKITLSLGMVGGIAGGAWTGAEIGAEVGILGGPAGMAAGMAAGAAVGAMVGYVVGTLGGYAAGAFAARFIFSMRGRGNRIDKRELWDWFGFRKYRVQIVYA